MKKVLPFLAVALTLTACSQRSNNIVYPTSESGQRISAEISYAAQGNYAECDITFVNAARQTVTVENTSLPFDVKPFPVILEREDDAFPASISAVCRDESRFGKSSVSVSVDGEIKERGSTTGFGSQAFANYFVDFETLTKQ